MRLDAPDACSVRAWRPGVPGVAEVFHAHIEGWGYPKHAHDTWTLLILDDGAIRFDLDRHPRTVLGGVVTIIPPGVVHDGRPAPGAPTGFTKRNLYLDASFLPEDLVGHAVDRTLLADPRLRHTLAAVHRTLAEEHAAYHLVHAEERLALVAERVAGHLRRGAPPAPGPGIGRGRADDLRALLDRHTVEPYLLAEAAAELGCSVATLVRDFRAAFDVTPHAYLVSRRVARARELLLDGLPPAEAAVRSGFHDQAHLTRHFRRHVATTPGRYARGV